MQSFYVYILQSESPSEHFYTGLTDDLRARLDKHNAGEVPHTAKFRPWKIKTAVAFTDRQRAASFETYLKTSSGRAFAKTIMKSPLKNKWVLITGASSGFGAAAAIAFAEQGAKLLLGARRVDRLEKIAARCRRAGSPAAHFFELDVSQTASVEKFFAFAKEKIGNRKSAVGNLHVLINNAGGAHGVDSVADGKDADWETTLQTNVLGILRVTRAALPMMPHDAGASIINIGSVAGRTAYAGGSAYCAAKAGELQITRALRHELLGTGIRVGTVDPGLAETEFSIVRLKGDKTKARDVYAGMKPLSAEDIAEILVWVAGRPAHVNIDEVLVKPVAQADVGKVFRKK